MDDDAWTRANNDFFATTSKTPVTPIPASAPTPTPDEMALLAQGRLDSERQMGVGGVVPTGRRLKFGEALEVGLNLARSSWTVVSRAPSLLAVTAIALVAGAILALAYAKLVGGPDALTNGGKLVVAVKFFPIAAVLGAIGSVAQGVIVVVVRDLFDGRSTSVSKGWGAAMARLPQLVGFGVIFAAERTATNMLRNTRGGKIAARAIDYAWDFATYLAVPVIMFEPGAGSYAAVKRSAQLVRTRLGVQLAATGTISLAVFVCTIPFLLVALFVGVAVSVTAGVTLAVLVLLTEMVVAATLQGVCSCVMYRFVTTGNVGGQFSEAQLMRVFGTRHIGAAVAY